MSILKKNKIIFKKSFEFPCSYIDGEFERRLYIDLNNSLNKDILISELTQNGFRRNQDHMYIPICQKCNLCKSSRINLKKFTFSKSNNRNLKINSDLNLVNKLNNLDSKRYDLFKKYCHIRHNESQMKSMGEKDFEIFFYFSKNKNKVYDLVDNNLTLYGSILVDILNDGRSAVYSFFDPTEKRRGLGKNMILKLIEKLLKENITYLYLGYWVENCSKMNYKLKFNNVELFLNGKWVNKNS